MEALVPVRVTPRAGRDRIGVWRQGRLEIRTAAPPVEGRANAAACRLIAAAIGVAPSRVAVVRGARGRDKSIQVTGLAAAAVLARLHHPEFA